jgi:1-acyl-sn-glycerol-3-phosphate acyltransferase
MNSLLRFLFYAVFIRLIVLIILGLNARHRERLPKSGPAIIVANHNSHLDTMVLMTLFRLVS